MSDFDIWQLLGSVFAIELIFLQFSNKKTVSSVNQEDKIMAAPAARRTVGQLLQQAWNEIPEIVATTGLGLIGIGLGVLACYNYEKNDGDNRRYKKIYVIMRPDDPRVAKIRKD